MCRKVEETCGPVFNLSDTLPCLTNVTVDLVIQKSIPMLKSMESQRKVITNELRRSYFLYYCIHIFRVFKGTIKLQ